MYDILWTILTIITALIGIFLAWVYKKQQYWKERNIFTSKYDFFFGHNRALFLQTESFGDFTKRFYFTVKDQKVPHAGFYTLFMPTYFPIDHKIIKSIMQNDFNHFVDRGVYFNEEADPLSAHLFALTGSKWRKLRVKLTPTFTSGKMKMMFSTLTNCGDQLNNVMADGINQGPVNIKEILVRFTIDIICSCAFGINSNALANPDSEINKKSKEFFEKDFWENITGFISFIAPDLAKKFNLAAINADMADFFINIIKQNVNYREKNNVSKKDFMHLLLQLKNRGELYDDENIMSKETDVKDNVSLTFNELAAQAFVFFLAGFETSSTTMTFCLCELATNPDIQEKLREEINEVLERHDNKLTYEAISEMHYMERVINETLRKYPPVPVLKRICTKEYKIPETDVILEEGTKVFIPIIGLQHDERYYPDPDKFDPERFTHKNIASRPPFPFLPFGEGPRNCIGLRFGMMQTKVGLSILVKNYRFSLSSKTTVPLIMDPKSFIMCTKGGVWLDYTLV